MARIVRKRILNSVKAKYYTCYIVVAVSAIICVLLVAAATRFDKGILFGVIPIIVTDIVFLLKARILKPGFVGEEKMLSVLKKMPRNYCVIPDLKLRVGDKTCNTDAIIVCKNGVYIVESKNYAGIISGNADDTHLCQEKKIKGGKTVFKRFYNPIKQVNTHCKLLKELLQRYGYSVDVKGIVLFTSNYTVLNVINSPVPIFSLVLNTHHDLERYIDRNRIALESEEREQIEKIILNNAK